MRHADKSTNQHHPRVDRRPTVDEPARILRNLTSLPDAEFASTYSPAIAAAFASYRDLPAPAAARRALLLALKAALKRRRAFILPRFTQAEDSWRIRECASYAVAITIIVEHAAAMHRVDHADPPPHPDVWARLLADPETDATATGPTTRIALFHSLVSARGRRWIAREPLVRTLIANYFTRTEPNELHEIVGPVVAGFGLDPDDTRRPPDDNPQLTQAAVPGPSSKPSSRNWATLLLRVIESGRAVFGRLRRERRLAHEADAHRDAAQTAAEISRKLSLEDAARRHLARALEPLATDLARRGACLAQLDVPTATRYLAAKRAVFERNLAAERNAIETILPTDRTQPTPPHTVSVPGPEHGNASPRSGSAEAHPHGPDPSTTGSLENAPATATRRRHADIPAISPPLASPTTAQQSLPLQAPLPTLEGRREAPPPTTKEPDTPLHRTPKPNRTRRSRSRVVDILDSLPTSPPPHAAGLPISPASPQRRPAIGDHGPATARIGHGAAYARSLMAENGMRLTGTTSDSCSPGPSRPPPPDSHSTSTTCSRPEPMPPVSDQTPSPTGSPSAITSSTGCAQAPKPPTASVPSSTSSTSAPSSSGRRSRYHSPTSTESLPRPSRPPCAPPGSSPSIGPTGTTTSTPSPPSRAIRPSSATASSRCPTISGPTPRIAPTPCPNSSAPQPSTDNATGAHTDPAPLCADPRLISHLGHRTLNRYDFHRVTDRPKHLTQPPT